MITEARRKEILDEKIESMRIANAELDKYDLRYHEMCHIVERNNFDPAGVLSDGFKMGMYQGIRYMESKIKKQREAEKAKITIACDEKVVKLVQKTEIDSNDLRGEMIYG